MFTLLGMAAKFAQVAVDVEAAGQFAVEEAAEMVKAAAKDLIGSNYPGWAPLAESTLAHKTADTPLLETGALKNSIEKTIGWHKAWVGTNDPKAEYHEFGTSRIPPRPFISIAAVSREKEIHALTRKAIGRALGGHGASEAEILLHAIREAGHVIVDTAKEIGRDNDNGK